MKVGVPDSASIADNSGSSWNPPSFYPQNAPDGAFCKTGKAFDFSL
jgi:hypothetical protein